MSRDTKMASNVVPLVPMPEKSETSIPLKETMPEREWDLLEMLTYKRPAGSDTEWEFIRRFLIPLDIEEDKAGNLWKVVGDGSPILWSSHTDTVHKKDGKQHLSLTEDRLVYADQTKDCLGADCTTGVWIMREMVKAGIPGTYVWHAGEEIGGVGSNWAAKNTPERYEGIKIAIAFDRKGTSDIITHQAFTRTASDEFALSLAECLKPLSYEPSDGGTFTDTANYESFIPECTNLAVGYHKQHTKHEYQDIRHACALLDAILVADFSKLVVARDPLVVEEKRYSYAWYKGNTYHWPAQATDSLNTNAYGGLTADGVYVTAVGNDGGEDEDDGLKRFMGTGHKQIAHQVEHEDKRYRSVTALEELVRTYPEDICFFLESNGFDAEMIEDWIMSGYTS